eukprot:745870-Alexandrium_andersonii.AAC.1
MQARANKRQEDRPCRSRRPPMRQLSRPRRRPKMLDFPPMPCSGRLMILPCQVLGRAVAVLGAAERWAARAARAQAEASTHLQGTHTPAQSA